MARFGAGLQRQDTIDGIPTVWAARGQLLELLTFLRDDQDCCYEMLFDLTAIDERARQHRRGQPAADFTVVYDLMSFSRNSEFRVKVALADSDLSLPSAVSIWPAANWYEREVFDMFGIHFDDHPNLLRILTPPLWQGHPLRKEHPARATEMDPFQMSEEFQEAQQESLRFSPLTWGRTTPVSTVCFVSPCSWTGRSSSRQCRTSATTIAQRRRWRNVSPGIPTSPIPTASTTSAAS
jgi:NADH-quinone oxidoreductase subunit C/D